MKQILSTWLGRIPGRTRILALALVAFAFTCWGVDQFPPANQAFTRTAEAADAFLGALSGRYVHFRSPNVAIGTDVAAGKLTLADGAAGGTTITQAQLALLTGLVPASAFTITRVPFATTAGVLTDDAGFAFTVGTNTLTLGEVGSGGSGDLVLKGNTSGTFTLSPPAAAGTGVLTAPTVAVTEVTALASKSGQVVAASAAGVRSHVERVGQLAANSTRATAAGDAAPAVYTFTGEGSTTIAANKLNDIGRTVILDIGGLATSDGSEAETLQHIFKVGSSTAFSSTAASLNTATTDGPWYAHIVLTAVDVTVPAAAKVFATGFYCIDPGAAGAGLMEPIGALLTLDVTGTLAVTVTHTWASGDASPDASTMDVFNILDSDVS